MCKTFDVTEKVDAVTLEATSSTITEENRKLKQIVADLSLDKAMLQHIVAKKV